MFALEPVPFERDLLLVTQAFSWFQEDVDRYHLGIPHFALAQRFHPCAHKWGNTFPSHHHHHHFIRIIIGLIATKTPEYHLIQDLEGYQPLPLPFPARTAQDLQL